MRRIALLLLVVLVVACGGGSGSDDDESSDSSGGSSAGAAAAATKAPDDSSATSEGITGQPASADVAAMPEPAGASGVQPILQAAFDDPTRSPFLVDEFENGAVTEIADGVYRITPADGKTQIMLPKSIPAVNNGIVDVNVSVEGTGAAGVSIRSRKDPQGTFSGYVCWISEPAGAGCSLNTKDKYTLMFSAPAGSVALQEQNALRVAMIGDTLQFEVNGTVIGQLTDRSFVSGNWGLYAESSSGGTATGSFDDVVVYRVTGNYALPTP